MTRRRRFWGWGWEDAGPTAEQARSLGRALADRFGIEARDPIAPPALADVVLPDARVRLPDSLRHVDASDRESRAGHTYGKSFRDVVRGLAGDFSVAPDVVARPADEADVAAVLDWATSGRVAVVPYGGGSSVVGGVEARVGDDYKGTCSLDLGGWIATRSGGHYATLHTHVDDFVESLRVLTPAGPLETRRLPGSGAGPSPDRLFIGSEGILGVVTEAWMRLQDRPTYRIAASVPFESFHAGARAARAIAQSGLHPSNCRLLDPGEAELAGAGDTTVLLLAFESADHALDAWMARALECAADHGGRVPAEPVRTKRSEEGARDGTAGAWRRAFLDGPYLRDTLVQLGMVSETFETAITWDRFEGFHDAVLAATTDAVRRVCGAGRVSCRFTHVYPDGPAPYYTVVGASRPGDQLAHWAEIKHAASEALLAHGGTITHHHAVGRDHRPWYDRQRPEAFATALRAAKRALDPAGILNPGVLIDPEGA